MNPFDLNGPNFLVFYTVCGAAVCLVLYRLRLQEPQTPEGAVPTDPQTIAYLRGGATEALRITAVTLLERGALAPGPARHTPHRPEPHAAARRLGDRPSGVRALSDGRAGGVALRERKPGARAWRRTRASTGGSRSHPRRDLRAARWSRLLAAVAALGTLAGVKIALALSRGHSNVGFLLLEAAVFGLIACRLTIRHRTPAGDRALDYLKHTFEAVRDRTKPLEHPDPLDIAVVAAVFGLAALPAAAYANVEDLRRRQDRTLAAGGFGGG